MTLLGMVVSYFSWSMLCLLNLRGIDSLLCAKYLQKHAFYPVKYAFSCILPIICSWFTALAHIWKEAFSLCAFLHFLYLVNDEYIKPCIIGVVFRKGSIWFFFLQLFFKFNSDCPVLLQVRLDWHCNLLRITQISLEQSGLFQECFTQTVSKWCTLLATHWTS